MTAFERLVGPVYAFYRKNDGKKKKKREREREREKKGLMRVLLSLLSFLPVSQRKKKLPRYVYGLR